MNRFVEWEADLTTVYNRENNNRTRSNVGSFEFMMENNGVVDEGGDDVGVMFGDRISKLEK